MAVVSEEQYGTFRCPVCGHRDGTRLDAPRGSRVVECTHCGTTLDVSGRGRESARFEAQVSTRESVRG